MNFAKTEFKMSEQVKSVYFPKFRKSVRVIPYILPVLNFSDYIKFISMAWKGGEVYC